MAKFVKQYRYYSPNNIKNQPLTITKQDLVEGSVFFAEQGLGAIIQLGIQSLPGSKFTINNGENSIIIGSTGIYELDLDGFSQITALAFSQETVDLIDEINNAFIIVDALYETEEG